MLDATVVKINHYISRPNLVSHLRATYEKETKLNADLGIEKPVVLQYYDYLLTGDDLQEAALLLRRIQNYWTHFRDTYRSERRNRENHGVILALRGKPGSKVDACVGQAIHAAREAVMQCRAQNQDWTKLKFVFHFNSVDFEFHPFSTESYSRLLTQVRRVVKQTRR